MKMIKMCDPVDAEDPAKRGCGEYLSPVEVLETYPIDHNGFQEKLVLQSCPCGKYQKKYIYAIPREPRAIPKKIGWVNDGFGEIVFVQPNFWEVAKKNYRKNFGKKIALFNMSRGH